jgi:hypothetical protein
MNFMRSKPNFVKLRGHHLICLHFFKGKGYSPEFIESLAKILIRAEAGAEIVVSKGADDVCKICPYLKQGKCLNDKTADAGICEMDKTALKLLGLRSGDEITWLNIRKRLPDALPQWSDKYCTECDWRWACEKAEGKF